VLLLLALGLAASAGADESLTIAVASNFRSTAELIAEDFTDESGIPVRLSSGSTGKLYAQIVNGAPYDIFLAADVERPRLLTENGGAIEGSLRVFAEGKLVLISADPELSEQDCLRLLEDGSYRRIAIANPVIAPYGAAAKAYLQAAGLWDDAEAKMVMGENVSQTFQFVATGNATLGIVSASQLADDSGAARISCRRAIDVPEDEAVHQGGVILRRSEMLEEARLFMEYLRSDTVSALVLARGYEVPED
jgi:molybdate transport system substrate-binding protein